MRGAVHRFILQDEDHTPKITLTNIPLEDALDIACSWINDEPETIVMLIESSEEFKDARSED